MNYRTLGGADPKGKPQIGFISHPNDVSRCLDTFCADVFRTLDCAVYFTEDMTTPLTSDLKTEIAHIPLFLMPVSQDLLTCSSCRILAEDLPYLISLGTPVLAIMIGPDMKSAVEADSRFQGVIPLDHGGNPGAVALYREELKTCLAASFGPQHDQPHIAFEALRLLERTPKPVLSVESLGLQLSERLRWFILRAADRLETETQEAALQDCLVLANRFVQRGMGTDPAVEAYLLGRALLNGLSDAALDREDGVSLITEAAENGLPEAMDWLAEYYANSFAKPDLTRSLYWQRKQVEVLSKLYGADDPYVLQNKNALAKLCVVAEETQEALRLLSELYPVCCRVLGERHARSIAIVTEFKDVYMILGDLENAAVWQEKLCGLLDDPQVLRTAQATLLSLYCDISIAHFKQYLKDKSDETPLLERRDFLIKALRLCLTLEDRKRLRDVVCSLSDDCYRFGEYDKAAQLLQRYIQSSSDDLRCIISLISVYQKLEDKQKEAEITEKAISLYIQKLGEDSYVEGLRKRLTVLRSRLNE